MSQKVLPLFDELPPFHNFPGCAWEVWGKDDQLGTVNLLTAEVVEQAAKEEIKTGRTCSLNWPINFPSKPAYGRMEPHHVVLEQPHMDCMVRDDELHINTQSGSQWDGLKHFGILEHRVYYNNNPPESLATGHHPFTDPNKVDPQLIKLGIHNWAKHGICSRGVLLDLVEYYTADGSALPYDPWTSHSISPDILEEVAKKEGVTFRTGDILIVRFGFLKKWNETTEEEKVQMTQHKFIGVEATDKTKRFLWNNHFAAIASDAPAFEMWPPKPREGYPDRGIPEDHALHQTLLGLWGMPIGEFFDLEELAQICKETGRYNFFFTSWPLNILGGVASPPNAAAYF